MDRMEWGEPRARPAERVFSTARPADGMACATLELVDRQWLAAEIARAVPSRGEGQAVAEHVAALAGGQAVTLQRRVAGWRVIGAAPSEVAALVEVELPPEIAPEAWLAGAAGGAWSGCAVLHGRRVVGRILHRGAVEPQRLAAIADLAAPWLAAREARRADDTPWLPVAQIVHDLRRPLTTLSLWLERLGRFGCELATARRAVRQLTLLVEDLLAVGAPEPAAPVELAPLLRTVLDGEGDAAARAGVTLSLRAIETATVRGRPRALERAIANLVANAVEASPPGATVEVAADVDGEGTRVTVRDGGRGIPPELRRRVLEPFFTTRAGGVGLGLAVVREVAR